MRKKQLSKLATVLFTTGTIGLSVSPVYAGQVIDSNDSGGKTTISAGDYDKAYGFYENDDVSNGMVTVSGGAVSGEVAGGYSNNGTSNSNIVTIFDNGNVSGQIYGGYGGYDSISNEIRISG